MYTKINDCGKQLTIHSKVREVNDGQVKEYKIIEVEFDQYKLELITREDLPATQKLHNIFNCSQLLKYKFEVEERS